MRRRRNPEIITGMVAADGTIQRGEDFTCTKVGGLGQYTLLFPSNFRFVAIAFTGHTNNNPTFYYDPSIGYVVIRIGNTSAVADTAFSFIATGYYQ
jgi:hypothetical protein